MTTFTIVLAAIIGMSVACAVILLYDALADHAPLDDRPDEPMAVPPEWAEMPNVDLDALADDRARAEQRLRRRWRS